jgi:hypothetical protein
LIAITDSGTPICDLTLWTSDDVIIWTIKIQPFLYNRFAITTVIPMIGKIKKQYSAAKARVVFSTTKKLFLVLWNMGNHKIHSICNHMMYASLLGPIWRKVCKPFCSERLSICCLAL